ncbi:MAG: PEP-CTERM sorting domain-containing protein [Planctomycetaceae bacterium]|nr:PEP-CTERM sorting domain-containing protein [Planctomycetaceae bacterium]
MRATLILVCVSLALCGSGFASVINIDTFNVGEQYVAGGSSDSVSGLSTSDVIGGERFFSVAGNARQVNGEINTVDYLGEGTYESGPRYSGGFVLEYGRTTDLNAALAAGGKFQLDFTYVDLGTGVGSNTITITVVADGQTDSYLSNWPATPGQIDIPASLFSAITAWNSVDRLTFEFSGKTAADVTLDNIAFIVPEPASVALLAMGGLAVLVRRKNRAG